jgi:ADP-ribose pyrophosphatase
VTDPSQAIVLAHTPYLRLVQEGHWTYAQRPNVSGATAIVAVTDDRQLVLVDQYRIPVHGRVIELPAGLVGDEPGRESETLEQAARRELLEEVGYVADRLRVLTCAVSSAGLTDEAVHLLLATGLTRVNDGGGNGLEDIHVHHIPLTGVRGWLEQQQRLGCGVDYKVYAALYFLADYDALLLQR